MVRFLITYKPGYGELCEQVEATLTSEPLNDDKVIVVSNSTFYKKEYRVVVSNTSIFKTHMSILDATNYGVRLIKEFIENEERKPIWRVGYFVGDKKYAKRFEVRLITKESGDWPPILNKPMKYPPDDSTNEDFYYVYIEEPGNIDNYFDLGDILNRGLIELSKIISLGNRNEKV